MNWPIFTIALLVVLKESQSVSLNETKMHLSHHPERRLSLTFPGFNENKTVSDYLSALRSFIKKVKFLRESVSSLVNEAQTEQSRVISKMQALTDTNSLDINLNNMILKEGSKMFV